MTRQRLILLVIAATWATAAQAGLSRFAQVASGLNLPVYVTAAPGDDSRLFVVELTGAIRVVNAETGQVNATPFLTLPDTIASGEGGLLGLAFHPEYETNGKFYTYSTADNGDATFDGSPSPFSSHVREFTVSSDPDVANPTGREIISWVQPTTVHNAGWIGFNPKLDDSTPQYLHIASGDGGRSSQAQSLDTPLGAILRVDVDADDFPGDPDRNYAVPPTNPFVGAVDADETLAYGLRNPWRSSFDSLTGDLWIGDVGAGEREEIDLIPEGTSGQNFAWPRREGRIANNGGELLPTDTEPVYDYEHGTEPFQGNSVIGGYVYRGPDPDLYGTYVFADNRRRRVWTFDPADPEGTVARWDNVLPTSPGTLRDPVSMGTDNRGNLYLVDLREGLFRIVTDRLIDGDYDANGVVDQDDYSRFAEEFGEPADPGADGNGDGVVNAADYTIWRDNLGATVADVAAQDAVPEATALSLAVLTVGGVAGRGRRFRRR
ncbi:PQQ-dependent sugar dehydrogenase [Botrimarina sp.]|uniref:PQQ-dependent sugar dehydrogenase n=1 Tax=Botrimarina sp. TaxID=2795802 RepID=UPI0032EDEF28